jgi:hypothetical protein
VFSIVAVNAAVQLLIKHLTRLELHRTRTKEGNSMMIALFVTQFINTAFSTLIANMYLPHIQVCAAQGPFRTRTWTPKGSLHPHAVPAINAPHSHRINPSCCHFSHHSTCCLPAS